MSFTVNSYDINIVQNFASAAAAWEAAKPWRNQHTSWRPLAGRRMPHKRIVKLSDDRGYECVLYNTPVVTYLADGGIALRCFDSRSTIAFASMVEPYRCRPVSSQGQMFWKVDTDNGTRYYREGKQALLFERTKDHNWNLLTQPAEVFETVNDNKKRATVRKAMKEYAHWHRVTEALLGHKISDHSVTRRLPNLNEFNNHENFLHIAKSSQSVVDLTDLMYLANGGSIVSLVPPTRLPRNHS